jgi:Zn-dependent protease
MLGGMKDDIVDTPHHYPEFPGPPVGAQEFAEADSARMLAPVDLVGPRRRRWFLPSFLFLATCISTFWAGATHWQPLEFALFANVPDFDLQPDWHQGLLYMAAVIGILLTHEMGHFLQTLRYHVPSSYPFFIPVPFVMTGTMGAVIAMEGSQANRKQLFDIGISGPIAGLLVAVPIVYFGIKNAAPAPTVQIGELRLGHPLIFSLLTDYMRPDLPPGTTLDFFNPLLMAGWVGMLITGLNMLPVSQLDGGHVIYGLFGRRAHWIARAFVMAAVAYMVITDTYQWIVMLMVILLIGVDHPPTSDDSAKLGFFRRAIGLASLSIPCCASRRAS